MRLNLFLELGVDVEAATIGLVLDPSDQVEPLLELLLVVAFLLAADRDDDVLELVH